MTTAIDGMWSYGVVETDGNVSLYTISSENNKKAVLSHELPRDAGHLYRKLTANPRATQWIERSLELSANMVKLSKNHFTRAPVKDWCTSPRGVTGSQDQSSRNSGNKFPLARLLTRPNVVALRQSARDRLSVVEKLYSQKVAKVHRRSPDLSPVDTPYTGFYTHSVVTLALDRFVSEISLVLYRKCHFCTYPIVFFP